MAWLAGQSGHVQEYLLTPQADGNSQWILKRDGIKIGDKAIYAPANLRSAVENPEYQKLMQYWMGNKYTLRYSGGMVPDVHHILTKVSFTGVQQHPALLYNHTQPCCTTQHEGVFMPQSTCLNHATVNMLESNTTY